MKTTLLYSVVVLVLALAVGCGSPPPIQAPEKPPVDSSELQTPNIQKGDTWVFELKRQHASTPYVKWTEQVVAVDRSRITCRVSDHTGRPIAMLVYGPDWRPLGLKMLSNAPLPLFARGQKPLLFPLWVGKRWKDAYSARLNGDPPLIPFRNQYTVVKQESLRAPAGTFDTWRIQISQNWVERFYSEQWHQWYAPQAKRIIKVSAPGHFTMNLLSYTPGSGQ